MADAVFTKLRPAAVLYVAAVSLAGSLMLAHSATLVDSTHSIALAVLMGLSLAASIAKITIPVAGNDSSLTVCHVGEGLRSLPSYGNASRSTGVASVQRLSPAA